MKLDESLFDKKIMNESRDYDGKMAEILDGAIDECFLFAQSKLGITSGDLPFD